MIFTKASRASEDEIFIKRRRPQLKLYALEVDRRSRIFLQETIETKGSMERNEMKRDGIAEAESKSRCSLFQVDVSDTIAKIAESGDLKMATNCCAFSRRRT